MSRPGRFAALVRHRRRLETARVLDLRRAQVAEAAARERLDVLAGARARCGTALAALARRGGTGGELAFLAASLAALGAAVERAGREADTWAATVREAREALEAATRARRVVEELDARERAARRAAREAAEQQRLDELGLRRPEAIGGGSGRAGRPR